MVPSNRAFRRASWGVADQVLSTATNLALAILVARSVSPEEFGAFSLAFTTYLIAINVARPVGVEPLIIRFSDQGAEQFRRASIGSISTAALVGLAAAGLSVVIGAVVGGAQGNAFIALAAMLPGLVIQDTWRLTFFAARRSAAALVNDLVWAFTMIPAIVLVLANRNPSVAALILAWGAGAGLAALVGFAQAGVRPSLASVTRWRRDHSDLTRFILADRLVSIASDQVPSYVIAALVGLPAVAAIRSGQLLLGPYSVLRQGLQLVVAPEGVRLLSASPDRLERGCRRFSAALVVGLLFTGAVALLLPESIGTALLGRNWEPARSVLMPLLVWQFAAAIMAGAGLGIYVLGAVDRALRLGIFIAAVTLVGALVGALMGSAWTAAFGIAGATWLAAAATWHQFWVAKREHIAGTAKVSRDRPSLPRERALDDAEG